MNQSHFCTALYKKLSASIIEVINTFPEIRNDSVVSFVAVSIDSVLEFVKKNYFWGFWLKRKIIDEFLTYILSSDAPIIIYQRFGMFNVGLNYLLLRGDNQNWFLLISIM